ncbi:CBASS oligonucleotide cyclase [Halorubrum ezzemoulense]|uniref:CBASS oligonucleotide cyclase n=1 Tax=Halorubrum ezzemoulense TaxID=337243 RepID=UPI00232CEFF9|nr:CBASS oligonucleotide cyclase [Halorubrum ezzemoulense]MDB2247378.1 CBASS oligonucleotide cyclase [Halorubrum ezzemoulense]
MGTRISSPGRYGSSESGGPSGSTGGEDEGEQTQLPSGRSQAEQAAEEVCEEEADDTAVSEQEGEQVAERREQIRETLDESLDIEEQHIFGSLTRGTLVGPLDENSDTDVMYVLDRDEHGTWLTDENGPQNCLQNIKHHLENDPRYDNADISIDRNVVAVQFNEFTVEVAPAFRQSGDYVIPDTYSGGRSWVRTNPRQYKQQFEAVDRNRNGNVSKLARLAKAYNERTGKQVSSYHMEVMAYDYARTRPQTDESLDELVDGFFEQLPRRLSSGTHDPATGQQIDDGMSREKREAAISDAKQAKEKLQRAERLKQAGETEKAERLYREVIDGELDD